jgi:hypothetical protein
MAASTVPIIIAKYTIEDVINAILDLLGRVLG